MISFLLQFIYYSVCDTMDILILDYSHFIYFLFFLSHQQFHRFLWYTTHALEKCKVCIIDCYDNGNFHYWILTNICRLYVVVIVYTSLGLGTNMTILSIDVLFPLFVCYFKMFVYKGWRGDLCFATLQNYVLVFITLNYYHPKNKK